MLSELLKILDGKEADQSSVARAEEILRATKEANDAQKKAETTQKGGA